SEIKCEDKILQIASDDETYLRSNRLFRKFVAGMKESYMILDKEFHAAINNQSHSLKKIHAQILQEMEGIVPNTILSGTTTYIEQIEQIKQKITKNPDRIAKSLLYIKKKIFELSAHMTSYEIIHMGKNYSLDIHKH